MLKNSLVVNLFAAPGYGKSTALAGLYSEMKWRGVNCEIATEAAKDLVWEESFTRLNEQPYVFGQQLMRIKRLVGKADFIITDSPMLLSPLYEKGDSSYLHALALYEHNKLNNVNFLLNYSGFFNESGRIHTLTDSVMLQNRIKSMLDENQVAYNISSSAKPDVLDMVDYITSLI